MEKFDWETHCGSQTAIEFVKNCLGKSTLLGFAKVKDQEPEQKLKSEISKYLAWVRKGMGTGTPVSLNYEAEDDMLKSIWRDVFAVLDNKWLRPEDRLQAQVVAEQLGWLRYRVYCCPEGSDMIYCGWRSTLKEAQEFAAQEPKGLERSMWETAYAAGDCGGFKAPPVDGEEEDEPLCWYGQHAVVRVTYEACL